nr:MAG TPA: hypothetical protein [Caudoviricetes sp.]
MNGVNLTCYIINFYPLFLILFSRKSVCCNSVYRVCDSKSNILSNRFLSPSPVIFI